MFGESRRDPEERKAAQAERRRDSLWNVVDPRFYAFGQGAFDHNFSQGLDLQQTYSGGIGWTLIDRANQTLDLKASLSYVRQQFSGAPGQN